MKKIIITIFALVCVVTTTARANEWKSQRGSIQAALAASEREELSLQDRNNLIDHPLYSWLEVLGFKKRLAAKTITANDQKDIETLLKRYDGMAAGDWLKTNYLNYLSGQKDWGNFSRFYQGSDDDNLKCADFNARIAQNKVDDVWIGDAQKLWLTGKSLPNACDAAFTRLSQLNKLDSGLRWQRIDLATQQNQTGLMRALATGLSAEDVLLVRSYADFIDAPHARYTSWPRNARSKQVAVQGLVRLAKRNPDAAEQQVAIITPVLKLEDSERGRVLNEVALWTVASYGANSAQRLNAVPEVAYDEKLHEWRVREAMSRGDDVAALAAIEKMGTVQRNDSRYQYFEARLRERLNQKESARILYAKAAQSANFHGWLAADRLNQPYFLCPLEPSNNRVVIQKVANDARIIRAFELFAIDRTTYALKEFNAALDSYNSEEKKVAIALAQDENWYDRAVFSIGTTPTDLQYYSLRFPLHHEKHLREQAKINSLDPAWVAGETRAESIFMPRARSGADARGLMQILPGTGAQVSARLGLPWRGGESLFEPETNITLGTAYLRQMLDRYDGFPYMAIAAYNAGPAPVSRWKDARSALEPDFWIETIPYKETRDYVSRVLAFSVVYDWRLDRSATSLTDRMLGRFNQNQRRAFVCPQPTTMKPL
ncbi:MAG: transglycosylase SLT domain-containing protein [Arenimonas sp.]